MKKGKRLYTAIERAAERLPQGWSVTLTVESGSAWVELNDCHDRTRSYAGGNDSDSTLDERIDAAVELALDLDDRG